MSQRQLSALRKLAQMTFILTPTDETRRLYEALKVMKAPCQRIRERASTVGTRARQADKLLRVWEKQL